MSTLEAAEVNRQMDAQLALRETLEAASELPEFATAYFDRDVLHVLTVGDPVELASRLSSGAPAGSLIEVGVADTTQLELAKLQDRIAADVTALADLDIHVVKIGVDPYAARVEVTVGPSDDRAAVQTALSDRYGVKIEVGSTSDQLTLLACNSRYDCGTKGGLAAKHAITGGTVYCTTAFVVRSDNTPFRYLMTAGHCIAESGGPPSTVAWRNQAGTLTWGKNIDYRFNANFDEGIFNLGATLPAAYNQYYASSASDIRTIDHAELTWAAMPVGLYVCRTGRTSNWGCGYVHRANITWNDNGSPHYSVWEVSQQSTYGDSGAGYIAFGQHSGTYPAGILFGGAGSYTYYYPATDDTAIGVHVCITAAC